jgi:hypothetical protein
VSLDDEIDPALRLEREVTDAIGSLDAGDKAALVRIARIYDRRSRCKVEDMIREAFDHVTTASLVLRRTLHRNPGHPARPDVA